MRRLVTSMNARTKRRLFVVAAACLVVFAGIGAGVREELTAADGRTDSEAPEPVLGDPSSSPPEAERAPREERPSARKQTPVVVRALAPGELPSASGRAEDRPPARILRENVRLRRELQHLRALEAERRRVAKALAAAGIVDGGALVGSGRLVWPLVGPLTSPFGPRWGRLHAGIDISAPGGTPIRAADSGRVALAGWQGGYGLYTCVKHTASLSTCYAHQSRLGTAQGAAVRKGQVIGYVGNTGNSFGNHLHFETWVSGRPVDPMGFL